MGRWGERGVMCNSGTRCFDEPLSGHRGLLVCDSGLSLCLALRFEQCQRAGCPHLHRRPDIMKQQEMRAVCS